MKILYAEDCTYHKNADIHPECPERYETLMRLFKTDFQDNIEAIQNSHVNFDIVKEVHKASYVDHLLEVATASHQNKNYIAIDGDTALSPDTLAALKSALSITSKAVEYLNSNQEQSIFACTRPPGHHAEFNTAMGFCFFDWIFIAAHILTKNNQKRALIIDFDVHHGNGTDNLTRHACRAGNTQIGFISLHESPLFPDTGLEVPEQEFPDNILNIPYPPFTNGSKFFEYWDTQVIPFIKSFKPDYLLISAGFDAHAKDPLSTTKLNENDFERIGASLAAQGIPLISFLEGGYNLEALENSVTAYLEGLENM